MYSSRVPPYYPPPPFPAYDYRPSPYLDYINRSHFAYPASDYFRRPYISDMQPIPPPISYRAPPSPFYYRDWDDAYFNRPPPPTYYHANYFPPPPPIYENYIPPPPSSYMIREPYAPYYGPPPSLIRGSIRPPNPNEIKPWESTRSGRNKSSKIYKKGEIAVIAALLPLLFFLLPPISWGLNGVGIRLYFLTRKNRKKLK